MRKIAFLGAGSWGTALAILCANNGHKVTIWSAVESELEMLRVNHEHKDRLPGVILPDTIDIESDIKKACDDKDIIVFSVASPFVRSTAERIRDLVKKDQVIVNVAKGIEDNTLMTLCEIIEDVLPDADVAVLSGPSHAEEVSKGVPTTVVVGAHSEKTAAFVQDVFMCPNFRVYTSPDMIGIELGGSLKNVIALAAGILDGMNMGDNTKAALMTRGIAEISRLGIELGGQIETFSGLSGIGDLIVTCTSKHSRNHNCGYLLGQGKTLEEAKQEINQVVEGVNTAKAAMNLANKNHVTMPIVEQINAILFENKSAKQAMYDLLERDKVVEYKSLKWDR
ncbi:MAG TPA: NAD(P)H-dependent glycerol-3-phosphate dehydrogenase [Lachnospiraceae bacterium]|nr:NAD(P)H-dependent glycerol-3-phosphate dehydrogenase [Lachnospiraceae bacterium]